MQLSGSTSSLPLSTQITQKTGPAAQVPGSQVTTEQVNSAVDRASDRVTQTQASRETNQAERRTNATQLYSASSQQRPIDTYLAVASEGKIDSNSGSQSTALQLNDAEAASALEKTNKPDQERSSQAPPPAKPEQYISISA